MNAKQELFDKIIKVLPIPRHLEELHHRLILSSINVNSAVTNTNSLEQSAYALGFKAGVVTGIMLEQSKS